MGGGRSGRFGRETSSRGRKWSRRPRRASVGGGRVGRWGRCAALPEGRGSVPAPAVLSAAPAGGSASARSPRFPPGHGTSSRQPGRRRGPGDRPATARRAGVLEPCRCRGARRPGRGALAIDGPAGHQGGSGQRGRPPRTGPRGEGAEGVALAVGDRCGPVLRPSRIRLEPRAPVPPARSKGRGESKVGSEVSPARARLERASLRRPISPRSRPARDLAGRGRRRRMIAFAVAGVRFAAPRLAG